MTKIDWDGVKPKDDAITQDALSIWNAKRVLEYEIIEAIKKFYIETSHIANLTKIDVYKRQEVINRGSDSTRNIIGIKAIAEIL